MTKNKHQIIQMTQKEIGYQNKFDDHASLRITNFRLKIRVLNAWKITHNYEKMIKRTTKCMKRISNNLTKTH
jgi:hypothetical protein